MHESHMNVTCLSWDLLYLERWTIYYDKAQIAWGSVFALAAKFNFARKFRAVGLLQGSDTLFSVYQFVIM